jgi:hypothetical protein
MKYNNMYYIAFFILYAQLKEGKTYVIFGDIKVDKRKKGFEFCSESNSGYELLVRAVTVIPVNEVLSLDTPHLKELRPYGQSIQNGILVIQVFVFVTVITVIYETID